MSARPDYWQRWAAQAAVVSPLYGRLATAIGEDDGLKALAAHAQPGQPHANMILAPVHYLLLRGAEHPLARFYATLGGTATLDDEDPFPLFADFVAEHESEIARLIETRVTNTNEVGRSAALHPGFRVVAAEAGTPLNLIEIGPSAGLNLVWDRYGLRYRQDGQLAGEYAPEASVVIEAELRGDKRPPLGPVPTVARRIGLELNPVDLESEEDRNWLRALVWPDNPARLARLDCAIAELRSPGVSVDIRRGDALENLLPALRTIPEDEAVCVFHTIALYQFSREMRATLEDLFTVAGLRRPIWRLSFEQEDRAQGFDAVLTLSCYHDGTRSSRRLALCQPHGAWLEWLD